MRRWETTVLIVLSVLLSLVYYYPILKSGNNLGIQDWDQNFAWTEATRISLIKFHQFPLWNPYKCGGSVQFANPQIPVISFQTLFALLFGTIMGVKLNIFFHGVIGFLGFFLLARQYKASFLGGLLAASLFSFSGITASFLSTGMVVFTSFAYSPYILLFFNKSLEKRRWGIICGASLAWSFYAGYHILLMLIVYMAVYTLTICLTKRSIVPLKALLIAALTAVLLVFPKLVLSIQLLRVFPRLTSDTSGYSLHNLLYFLLSQQQNLYNQMNVQGVYYGIDENSLYIGIIPFVLFLLFFVLNKKGIKDNVPLLLTMLIIIWIMLGDAIHPSIYALIRHLPVFSSFRVAQRFRFDFIIPFSLLAGLGLDNAVRLLQRYKLVEMLGYICLLVVFIDLTWFSSTNFLTKTLILINPEGQLSWAETFIQTKTGGMEAELQRTLTLPEEMLNSNVFAPWSLEYLGIEQNKGTIRCYDSITGTINAVAMENNKYRGEFYLLDPHDDSVEVENSYWSPNKLIFKISNVEKAVDNTLVVNQNYFPGWIVKTDGNPCKQAIHSGGLLATKIDATSEVVTFEYNPFLRWSICRR